MKVTVEVKDETGMLIASKKGRSWVHAFLEHLYAVMFVSTRSVKDTAGASRTIPDFHDTTHIHRPFLELSAGSGVTSFGIVVGTSTQAVAPGDHTLISQIAEGTGAGQLSHGGTTSTVPYTTATKTEMTISRTFTNNSGATITVNEVGLYSRTRDTTDVLRFFCIERALLTFTIENGTSKTVTYTITSTV